MSDKTMKIDSSKYNIIDVVRFKFNENSTNGRLYVNGKYFCFTLEPPHPYFTNDKKPYCIPEGIYDVSLNTISPKYRKVKPYIKYGGRVLRLKDVPNFDGVLIHIGNFPKDTKGCILVGDCLNLHNHFLINSTSAYLKLWNKLTKFKYPIKIRISKLNTTL